MTSQVATMADSSNLQTRCHFKNSNFGRSFDRFIDETLTWFMLVIIRTMSNIFYFVVELT